MINLKVAKVLMAFMVVFMFSNGVRAEEAQEGVKENDVPKHHFILIKPKLLVSFTDNRSVPGKTDGMYFRTDLDLLANYDYKKNKHEFLNELEWKEGVSLSPMYDGFVISADRFKFDTRYNFMFNKIGGYFVKAGFETHFLPGYDYQTEEVTYLIDGDRRVTANKYKLTSPGYPFYLHQATGLLYRPVEKETQSLEFTGGVAARQVFVKDSLKIVEDDSTPERDLKTMTDIYEVGGEATVRFKGSMEDKKIEYDARLKAFMPFYTKDREENGLSWGDVFQLEGSLKIDFNINKYVAFNYEFNLKRDFAIVRDWQITNSLNLAIFYEFERRM